MKETKNILDQESLRKAPFTVPEGYFATVEDRVRERVAKPAKASPLWRVLKPGIAVAAMFLIIFGIGPQRPAAVSAQVRGHVLW